MVKDSPGNTLLSDNELIKGEAIGKPDSYLRSDKTEEAELQFMLGRISPRMRKQHTHRFFLFICISLYQLIPSYIKK